MGFDLSVSAGNATPIYRQIADQICRAVATGALAPGEQLPSVRQLAEQLVVNPNTVARTYSDLIHDGVLDSRQGKGVFVARRRPVYTKGERQRRIRASLDAFVNQGLQLGFSPQELREALESRLAELESAAAAAEAAEAEVEVGDE